jgi:hypothetical protein
MTSRVGIDCIIFKISLFFDTPQPSNVIAEINFLNRNRRELG